MKTSNKILLGLVLLGFGYLACAQIALHVKYVNNSTTPAAKFNALYYNEYTLPAIKTIRIIGLAECDLSFADTNKLEVEKSGVNYITYNLSGDTLTVNGQYPESKPAEDRLNRSPQNVRIYINPNTSIFALNSNIKIKGGKVQAGNTTYRFNLNGSNLFTRYNYKIDSLDRYFDTLSVNAVKNSQVLLFKNDHFKVLDLTLDNSLVNDYHAKVEQENVTADSNSVIVITGGNMNKLNPAAIKK